VLADLQALVLLGLVTAAMLYARGLDRVAECSRHGSCALVPYMHHGCNAEGMNHADYMHEVHSNMIWPGHGILNACNNVSYS
jgi:hypothetical protein